MKVLVCGSRSVRRPQFAGAELLLDGLLSHHDDIEIVHGCAFGADTYGGDWAKAHGLTVHQHPADWATHGKAAGPIRNQTMLDEHDIDLVIAVVDKPLTESRGTADMVRRARKVGIPVHLVRSLAKVG